MKKIILFATFLFSSFGLMAQQHQMSQSYVAPDDTLVREKLGQWKNLKFGLYMQARPLRRYL
jgi:alpha-L-fucosidase